MWHCVEIEIEIKIKLDPIKRSVHIEHFQNTRMQDVLNEQILGSGITSCTNVVLQDLARYFFRGVTTGGSVSIEQFIYKVCYLFKVYLRSHAAVVVASPGWLSSLIVVSFRYVILIFCAPCSL